MKGSVFLFFVEKHNPSLGKLLLFLRGPTFGKQRPHVDKSRHISCYFYFKGLVTQTHFNDKLPEKM